MKKGLRWTDIPLIVFGGSLAVLVTIYIFTGTNLLHDISVKSDEVDGARWISLSGMTVVSSMLCWIGRSQ